MPINMTAQKAKSIAESLSEFMAARKFSQRHIAEQLGVSTTLLSQYLAGKYKGDLEDITNRAVNFINSLTRREGHVRGNDYIETSVAKKIGTLIIQTEAFSDEEGKIGLIIGDGGHGKSKCLRQYAQANRNTIYVELDDAMTSTLMFAAVAEKLHIDSSGSLASVTRRLIDNLQNRHIILMLDEASGLSVRQLNQLRQIIVVKSRCPLILAGNNHLLHTVMQPTTRAGYESLDQFTSRLMCILDLDSRASDKDGGLYTVEDVRKLYEYGGFRLTNDAVAALRKICKTPRSGRLRTCSHIIAALHVAPEAIAHADQGKPIDAMFILRVIAQLDLPVKVRLPMTTAEITEQVDQAEAIAKAG